MVVTQTKRKKQIIKCRKKYLSVKNFGGRQSVRKKFKG